MRGKKLLAENYYVEVRRDPKTRIVIREDWYEDGPNGYIRHRVDGPATICRDPESGNVTEEYWCRSDLTHREDGPAIIIRHPTTGVVVKEAWYIDGRAHRPDGPARITRNHQSGEVTSSGFRLNGQVILGPRRRALATNYKRGLHKTPSSGG